MMQRSRPTSLLVTALMAASAIGFGATPSARGWKCERAERRHGRCPTTTTIETTATTTILVPPMVTHQDPPPAAVTTSTTLPAEVQPAVLVTPEVVEQLPVTS